MSERSPLDLIINFILTSKALEDVFVALQGKEILRIGEVSDLGKLILTGAFFKKTEKNILFLSSRGAEMKVIAKEWGVDVCDILEARYGISSGNRGVVISNFEDIFRRVASLEEYKGKIIKLKVGDKVDLVWLADRLVNMGYERVKKPDGNGEFNIKGDTLEVFLGGEKYRVEFFGDQVEKILFLDVEDQNSASLQELGIYPNKISEGDDFFIKYFDNYLFIIDGEDILRSHIFSIFQGDDGQISQDEIGQMRRLEDFLKKQHLIYLESFSVGERAGINLRWFEPKRYHGNTSEFLTDLKVFQRSKTKAKQVVIVSEKTEQLKKVFQHNAIDGFGLVQGKINGGINLGDLGITVFSDREIFGEKRKTKRRKVDFSALTNLKRGEYVVHIDHGIGVFAGFGEIVVDNIKREYIFIEYSGGDRIYVPLDQADKITKYIAVGNSPPHLSSLKTGQWLKIKKKVAENAEKIAKELLETQALRSGEKNFYYVDDTREQAVLEKTFPYRETPDQKKTIEEVLEDLKKRSPMDRIVCGDVGYGKTEVAIRAATRAVVSGGQVAVLVPTTILAEQHLQTFRERLDQFGFKIESLSRFRSAGEQKKVIEKIESGGVDIVVGTHRLLSKDITFKNLFLVVIDEEQKFGVKHKEKLKKLRSGCDILTMTATPIPRTLYLGLGGLKDISIINTPPEGRLPIKTIVIKEDEEIIRDSISKEVERGGQVYFVHNRVETILAMESKLKKLLPKVRFIVGHGQMPEEKLARVMNDFAKGLYDVLICSTIIESGLDISTVNTLIVDRATNFGLSQLHQLRGRIGRSHIQAYAYFLYNSEDLKGNAKKRLAAISEKEELGSGYELSLEDLDIRGSGNILGEEQHGSMQMVGVGYYLKLLEEAVEKLKGESESVHISDIKIDLPISSYIPDGFYKNEEDKIKAYQLLAGIEDIDEVVDFERGLTDAFGELPLEFRNLIEVVKLKIKAKKAGIDSIIVKDILGMGEKKVKKLFISFDHILSKEEVGKIFATNHKWYFGNMLAKINLDDLGEDWFQTISNILNVLAQ